MFGFFILTIAIVSSIKSYDNSSVLKNKKVLSLHRDKTRNPAVPPKLMFPSTLACTFMQSDLITGTAPVGYYLLSLSTALISPFTWKCGTGFPPSPALWSQCLKVTTLNHRFRFFSCCHDFITLKPKCQQVKQIFLRNLWLNLSKCIVFMHISPKNFSCKNLNLLWIFEVSNYII